MPGEEPLVDSFVNLRVKNFSSVMNKLQRVCNRADKLKAKGAINLEMTATQARKTLTDVSNQIDGIQKRLSGLKLPKLSFSGGGGGGGGGRGSGSNSLVDPEALDVAKARFNELSRSASRFRTVLREAGRNSEIPKINSDLENLRRRLREAGDTTTLNGVTSETRALRDQINRSADSTARLTRSIKNLTANDVERIRNQAQGLRTQLLQARIETDRFSSAFRNIGQTVLNRLQISLKRISSDLITSRRTTGRLSDQTKKLQRDFDRVSRRIRAVTAGLRTAAVAASALSAAARGVASALSGSGLGVSLNGITAASQLLVRSFDRLLRFNFSVLRNGFASVLAPITAITRSLSRIIQFGPELATAFTAGQIKETFRQFETFEDSIRRAASEFREFGTAGEENIDRFSRASVRVGRTVLATQDQIAAGIRELGRSGVDSSQVTTRLLRTIANFGQSAELSLDKAAQAAITVSNQFGRNLSQFDRTADALQAAANISPGTGVNDLLPGFANVADSARQINVSLEETLAVFSRFRQAGQGLSQAGTTLTTFASRLQRALREPTANNNLGNELIASVERAAKRNNLQLSDIINLQDRQFADGGLLRLLDVGETSREVRDVIQELTGIRGFRLNLLFRDVERVRRNFEAVTNSAGLTDQRVRAQNKSIRSQRTLLNAVISAIRTQLGSLFEGDIASGISRLREAFETLSRQIESTAFRTFANNFRDGLRDIFNLLQPTVDRFARIAAFANTIVFTGLQQFATRILPVINDRLDQALAKLESVTGLQLRGLDFEQFLASLNVAVRNFNFDSFLERFQEGFKNAIVRGFQNALETLIRLTPLVGIAVSRGIEDAIRSSSLGRQLNQAFPGFGFEARDEQAQRNAGRLAIEQARNFAREFRLSTSEVLSLARAIPNVLGPPLDPKVGEIAKEAGVSLDTVLNKLKLIQAIDERAGVNSVIGQIGEEVANSFSRAADNVQQTGTEILAVNGEAQSLNRTMQATELQQIRITRQWQLFREAGEGAFRGITGAIENNVSIWRGAVESALGGAVSSAGEAIAENIEVTFTPRISSLSSIQDQIATLNLASPELAAQQSNTTAVQQNTSAQQQLTSFVSELGKAVNFLNTRIQQAQDQDAPPLLVVGN